MIDTTQWNLLGPVRSVRCEVAEWDAERREWKDRRFFRFVVFDVHGRVAQLDQRGLHDHPYRTQYVYDADGRLSSEASGPAGEPVAFARRWTYDDSGREMSIVVARGDGREELWQQSTYDDQGRRTDRVLFPSDQRLDAYAVKGSEFGYGAPGAVNQITRYDESGQPLDTEFFDQSGAVVRRVRTTRDQQGRVVEEDAGTPFAIPFPREPGMSDAEFDAMRAAVLTAMGTMRTVYEYDNDGRQSSRTMWIGSLAQDRITYRYDERGNLLEQSHLRTDRGIQVAHDGAVQTQPDTTRAHDTRFAYVYDAYGNWTEKTVTARYTDPGEFRATNAEWRTIEYWQP